MNRAVLPTLLLGVALLSGCVGPDGPGPAGEGFPPDQDPSPPGTPPESPPSGEIVPPLEGPEEQDGSTSIYASGASASQNFTEIHVAFSLVEVRAASANGEAGHSGDGNEASDPGDEEDPAEPQNGADPAGSGLDSAWHAIVAADTDPLTIDLLNATAGLAAFLGEADVPWGNYQQIRLTVVAAWGIDQDGVRHEFQVGGEAVELDARFQVQAGQETRLLLEIDIDSSIQEQNDQWVFHPVPGTISSEPVPDEWCGDDRHEQGEIVPVDECHSTPGDV